MNTGSRRTAWVAGTVALMVAASVGIGYWWGTSRHVPERATSAAGIGDDERRVLYWYDPMVPDQHFDKPGKSPFMDMQLVPRYADEVGATGIAIDPATRQNLGIRAVEVTRGQLASAISVPGTIAWDLRQERVVSARVDAIIERLFVKAPFEPVRSGQPLASVLAPAWSTALAEARALDAAPSPEAAGLRSAAHARLRALGLPAGAVARGGSIVLTSPVSGVVSEIAVGEGQSVPAGTLLFRVNGTQTVWLEAAIPQAMATHIAPGTPVEATVTALPDRRFTGTVETMLPQLDPASRTQRARIVLDNRDGLLAPGMFAQIRLDSPGKQDVVLVPTDALIGGGDDARVIVQDAQGRFAPVAVRTGGNSGGMTEVLSGLKGGERVVASGQFLIDSEANLSGALERLGRQPEAHQHPMPDAPEAAEPKQQMPTDESGRKVLYWYDPMVPDKHFDKPGKLPYMDMPLVPKYADDEEARP